MKIISKFKDYYDISQGLAYDPGIVYVRKTQEIEPTQPRYHSPQSVGTLYLRFFVIGFCGKVHPLIQVAKGNDKYYHCYSISELDVVVEASCEDDVADRYHGRPVESKGKRHRWPNVSGRVGLRKTFEAYRDRSGFRALFAQHNVPIWLWDCDKETLTLNPLLRNWEFARVMDPYTAYQEIEMYLGGVLLRPVNPVPEVPDEIMQEIKGFDHKYSFRKEPKEDK